MYKRQFVKNNVSVPLLTIFYKNSKILMYKVIGTVIYTINDYYIFLDYLDLIQQNLSKYNNNFENTKFNDLSGLGMPDIL